MYALSLIPSLPFLRLFPLPLLTFPMTTSTPTLPVSLTLMGLFSLREGSRISIVKPAGNTSTTVYYQQYLTAVACLSGQRIPATLRVYSPPGDHALPDGTVILAFTKALFLKAKDVSLEVIRMAPFPGDPSSDEYQDNIPDWTIPMVSAVGHVGSKTETLEDGHKSRLFPITAGDYIGNSNQTCEIHAIYDGSTKRWTSTSLPKPHSCVEITGVCRELSPAGILRINLDKIVMNVAPRSTPAAETEDPNSPAAKRRKFSAFPTVQDSPSTPSTSTIPSSAPSTPSPSKIKDTDASSPPTPADMPKWATSAPTTPSPRAPRNVHVPDSPEVFSSTHASAHPPPVMSAAAAVPASSSPPAMFPMPQVSTSTPPTIPAMPFPGLSMPAAGQMAPTMPFQLDPALYQYFCQMQQLNTQLQRTQNFSTPTPSNQWNNLIPFTFSGNIEAPATQYIGTPTESSSAMEIVDHPTAPSTTSTTSSSMIQASDNDQQPPPYPGPTPSTATATPIQATSNTRKRKSTAASGTTRTSRPRREVQKEKSPSLTPIPDDNDNDQPVQPVQPVHHVQPMQPAISEKAAGKRRAIDG
ncbi:hypothetical protein DFH06DRAFT_1224122 [Mycena polygramma]|nr:hypothetical protein DFH06DRAFT_1224122 [Mycena polygramma]